ncbi:protein DpdJ [Mesorhizobium sp.]|uniref:protein DpdJ n=1 Tax=Mesorhizobium sp. TaxID=1871066 RepID=UPI000FE4E984|nr:protein DpdJ [Mesorhizobium sp.]RWO55369.1 MAG: DEAD/DEAH box helicase [Mesorhizobium sp.]
MPVLTSDHDALLSALEDIELLSLRWGDVNGSLSRDEAVAVAEGLVPGAGEETLEALIEAALVYEFDLAGVGPRYRSRFGETLRLLARLRQTFLGEPWRGSPPLVADFRVDVRSRRYPDRFWSAEAALAEFDELTELQRAVFRAAAPAALAAFQVRASQRLLTHTEADTGIIVGAGTGAGKTLAFYLPVFVRLAELVRSGKFWTKAIAIYPRKELLKDQLSEAFRRAVDLSPALTEAQRRPIRIGAYYADTPRIASHDSVAKVWLHRRLGFICPFLRCECGGDMIWTDADLAAGRERLQCGRGCGRATSPDVLVLTRQRQQAEPPDILFTTTEMLNRSLSDQGRRALFGIRCPQGKRPEFLLLDEAHTYSGAAGAQAALTLRRWRYLAGGPVAWVGLSATLQEAPQFFGDLTGLDPSVVAEITPLEDEMVEEGREYQVALRGDPAARASLLSTSIQAAMLLGRILDPEDAPSQRRFGRRLFAFTDDLDVTHRFFDDLRDAEAYDRFGRPDPARSPLASMRAQTLPGMAESDGDRRARDADGQRWRLVEALGRNLEDRLRIARTTSRDPGVDAAANVIVATAALEVGFNDPLVGAVLQHKAPRDFASFLQRRGRAGRDRLMRPLTVTVLSDYGRDRQLFQGYEHLFDPTLDAQTLPVRNEYVLRMQAAFVLLDWIGDQARPPEAPASSVWRTVAEPSDPAWNDRAWREHIRRLLAEVMRGETPQRHSLRDHLKTALRLDAPSVDRLLWEAPRSLLLEVVPTLTRRLMRDWNLAWPRPGHAKDRWAKDKPLPDFAPSSLFADLNLPELEIVIPPARQGEPDGLEGLPLQQGLNQLVPGRVTRRFGDAYGGLSHWFPVPAGITAWDLPVSGYAEVALALGHQRGEAQDGWTQAEVYRPLRVRLATAQRGVVGETSNARLRWASGFAPQGVPVEVAPPPRTAWRGLVTGAEVYLHRFRAGVRVIRFATGARAEIRRPGGVEQVVDITFRDDAGSRGAVGYEFETDGLALRLQLPSHEAVAATSVHPSVIRGVRSSCLKLSTAADTQLPRELNGFVRAWLRQAHLLTCARRAMERGEALGQAAAAIHEAAALAPYEAVLDSLLGVQRLEAAAELDAEQEDQEAEEGGATARTGRRAGDRLERLKERLLEALRDPQVRDRLHRNLLSCLDDTSAERHDYETAAIKGTLAEALLVAAAAAAPRQAAADAVLADVLSDEHDPSRVTIWLTETTLGGAGVLQAIGDRFATEPRVIFSGLEAALEPSDLEVAASALARTYRLAADDPAVAATIAQARSEFGHAARAQARESLLTELRRCGVEITRPFVVTLNARLLAPGIRFEHDHVVRRLLDLWDAAEARLGVELDPRELAVLAAEDQTAVDGAVAAGLFSPGAASGDRALALGALLWPKALALHRQTLSSWNPYRTAFPSEPALVRSILFDGARAPIALEEEDWWTRFAAALAEDGVARLAAPLAQARLLGEALLQTQVQLVHVGHLQLYPVLERIAKNETHIVATFVLREQV